MLEGRIISMPHSPRVAPCLASWQKVLDSVTVFPAVVGKHIECNDPRISTDLYKRLITTRFNPLQFNTDYMTNKAQIGCALSHIALWNECVHKNRPLVIIEDDTVVQSTRKELDIQIRRSTLTCLIYWYLSNEAHSGKVSEIRDTFYGTQAYYIEPPAAKLLLRHAFPLSLHIDRYMAYVAARFETTWKCAYPRLQFKTVGQSTLSHEQVAKGSSFSAMLIVLVLLVYFITRATLPRCRK